VWRSTRAISRSFTTAFGSKVANHWVLDAGEERHTPFTDDRYPRALLSCMCIDVKAEHRNWVGMIWFSY
jgi:hypothetical protein